MPWPIESDIAYLSHGNRAAILLLLVTASHFAWIRTFDFEVFFESVLVWSAGAALFFVYFLIDCNTFSFPIVHCGVVSE